MKGFLKRLEKLMMAVTFAEAGEHEAAREIMQGDRKTDRVTSQKRTDKTMRASSPPMR